MLELHEYNGEEYYLGAFLVGAYQEILGDLHNLLGDTNAVHVTIDDDGTPSIDEVVDGDTVREVLSYVQFNSEELVGKLRKQVEAAVREKKISLEEGTQLMRYYEDGMRGYTYLEEPSVIEADSAYGCLGSHDPEPPGFCLSGICAA